MSESSVLTTGTTEISMVDDENLIESDTVTTISMETFGPCATAEEGSTETGSASLVGSNEAFSENTFQESESSIFDDMSSTAALEFVDMVTSVVLDALPPPLEEDVDNLQSETKPESEKNSEINDFQVAEIKVRDVNIKEERREQIVVEQTQKDDYMNLPLIIDESGQEKLPALKTEEASLPENEDCKFMDSNSEFMEETHGLATVESILGLNAPGEAESSPEVEIIELDEPTPPEELRKRVAVRNRSIEEPILPLLSPGGQVRRPRRVIFSTHRAPNQFEGPKHGLRLVKFPGMGTHEIGQRVSDRGHILHIDGTLRWVGGQTSPKKRTWYNLISEDGDEFDNDEDDMTIGGPLDINTPMSVTPVCSLKWRYRKKMKQAGGQVDPSSVVPNSVSSSLGSTGSASETELGTDEDEDDAELASQGWIVTKSEGRETPTVSPSRVQEVEYELVEEPEFVMESEPVVVEGPPQKKRKHKHEPQPHTDGKIYPKPGFSYSCLIAMSLKNSNKGSLPVSEIYKFMCDHFPYFKSAPSGWKNSVRHNLSLNKCFEKIEKPGGNAARKGCLWGLCRGKENKMDEEVQKWLKKDPGSVLRAMSDPENLELIERGELKRDYSGNTAGASDEDEDEEETVTPIRVVASPRNTKIRQATAVTTTVVNGETIITTTPVTMSTIRTSVQPQQIRVIKAPGTEQVGVTDDQKQQTIELAQLGSVQGNYLCHPNGTFTLSFTGIGNQSSTPLIIRRTPVK